LHDLYNAGVLCGHGGRRRELEERLTSADGELEGAVDLAHALDDTITTLRAELDHVRRMTDRDHRELHGALDAARARVTELETSTAWRMTAPMRTTLHQVKRAQRAFAEVPRLASLVGPRLATARHIAREQGWTELARR